jgi:hypothetical protein
MKKFGLLVGNGFTLDYSEPHGLYSSFPLKNFKNKDVKYSEDFLAHLPEVTNKLINNKLSDYNAIENYVNTFKDLEEESFHHSENKDYNLFKDTKYDIAINSHIQLRRFLAMAYSVFQLKLDQYNDINNWKWVNWLTEHKDLLEFCISFNYDLVLENALNAAKVPYYRVGTNEFFDRVPLIKPHGSIDFDVTNFISVDGSPWAISASLNDGQFVEIVPKSKWLEPRIEADIISPSLYNTQTRLSWVKRMFDQYSTIAQNLDALVIIGCSYWSADRPEIDIFLQQLKRRTKVYVIDLNPNKDLKRKIQALGLSYREANMSGLPW